MTLPSDWIALAPATIRTANIVRIPTAPTGGDDLIFASFFQLLNQYDDPYECSSASKSLFESSSRISGLVPPAAKAHAAMFAGAKPRE